MEGEQYCKGLLLLGFIEEKPGLSGWGLSQLSSVPYADCAKGLAKLREHGAVLAEQEDRGDGTYRYRHWPANNPDAREHFLAALRRVEALQ